MSATLDWYGCATFRLRSGGVTVFLDAYAQRIVSRLHYDIENAKEQALRFAHMGEYIES